MSALTILSDEIYGLRDSFDAVLIDRSINFDREAEFAIQIIGASDYAMKLARENPNSVRNAVTNIAAIGISLNPAKKQAYLVPRKGGICLDISYMGLLDLAVESGSIRWGQAKLVHEKDTFILNGIDREPTHTYSPFEKDRGVVVGVYCVVKTIDGDYLTEAMSIDEVNAVRDRSDAWKAYVEKKKTCPWVTDPGEMTKKTVIKRAHKYWPRTDRLDEAIHHLNTDGGEGIDLSGAAAKPVPDAPADLLTQAREAALKGIEELKAWWNSRAEADRIALKGEFKSLRTAATKADADRTIDAGVPA